MARFTAKRELDQRDPSLIDLPLPVPSIPIINGVITPLIGGNQPAPTPTPSPTTVPSNGGGNSGGTSGGSNGGGGNSGGSSGDSSGGSSGGGSGGGNSGGGNGSSGNSSQGSTTGGQGGSSVSNGSGTNNTNTGGNGSGNASQSSSGSDGQSGGSSTSGAENSSATSPTENVDTSSNSLVDSHLNAKPAGGNSESGSGVSSISRTIVGASTTFTQSSNEESNIGGSSNVGASGGPSPSNLTSSNSANGHKGLSTGAVAAISVVSILLFLVLIVCLLRRRSMVRRSERRNRWWMARNASMNSVANGSVRGTADATAASGTISARSSFATTFDHGLAPHLTLDFSNVPELPPMAEIRGGEGCNATTARGPVSIRPLQINVISDRRASIQSANSNNSDQDAQYLVVHPVRRESDLINLEVPTPMSVRPFSPSESFSFPKPPKKQSDDWTSEISRPQSEGASLSRNVSVKSSAALQSATSPPEMTVSPNIPNPFADPEPAKTNSVHSERGEFADIEVIQRPFAPSLEDELAVFPGDRVRVLQTFDDGWAFIEKIIGQGQTQSGLIPIDCLRAEDQDLPAFIASKRVSSYSEAQYKAI